MLWLDPYERRARVAPGLLALLPLAVAVAAVGLRDAPVVATLLSVLSLAGGPVLLSAYVRQCGLDAQEALWARWGGSPTLQALRCRTAATGSLQRDQWRGAIERVTAIPLLSARAERANPEKADEAIEVAVAQLREATRDEKTFPLVSAELKNYGFERNLYGMKRTGIVVSVLAVAAVAIVVAVRLVDHAEVGVPVLGVAVNLILLLGWVLLPSEKRTRSTAEKYSHQLLQGAVQLDRKGPEAS
jgi:hypothetical protein